MKIAICDDEIRFIKQFKNLILSEFSKFGCSCEFTEYTNSSTFLHHHFSDPFDAVFMDIDMPGISGFDVIQKIKEAKKIMPHIVFVTSHPEFVFDSFEYEPINYLVKDYPDFDKKIHLSVKQIIKHKKQSLTVEFFDEEYGKISKKLSDITHIESSRHYVLYYTNDDMQLIKRQNISEIEYEYSTFDYTRIHKKFIVNLRYIYNLDLKNNCVILRNKKTLPIGRSYKDIIIQEFNSFLRRD